MTAQTFILFHFVAFVQPLKLKSDTMHKIYIFGYTYQQVHPVSRGPLKEGKSGCVVVQKYVRRYDEEKMRRRIMRLHKEKNIEINFIKQERP